MVGGIFLPHDGQTNPIDTTMALAKGARRAARDHREHEGHVDQSDGARAGVLTDEGDIAAEPSCCAGMWARALAHGCGVTVPLHAAEHFYIVTEPMDLPPDLPVLRDMDDCAYYKEDAGKLLIGAFEPKAKPWGMNGIPEDFVSTSCPRTSSISSRSWRAPSSACRPWRGRHPQVFQRPGELYAGRALYPRRGAGAEAFLRRRRLQFDRHPVRRRRRQGAGGMDRRRPSAHGSLGHGHPPIAPFQANKAYLCARVSEALGLLYAMHWPYRQYETARKCGLRRFISVSPIAAPVSARWPAGSGPTGSRPKAVGARTSIATGGRTGSASAAENRAVREAVAIFDMTSFAKFLVQGPDAESELQRICADDVAVPPGRVVYTQWLNERGGIEADLTVTRLSERRS